MSTCVKQNTSDEECNDKTPRSKIKPSGDSPEEKPSLPAEDDDDDAVQLSAFTMSALQEFVSEQLEREQRRQQAERTAQDASQDPNRLAEFEEDWVRRRGGVGEGWWRNG